MIKKLLILALFAMPAFATVPSAYAPVTFTGNGSTVAFSFTFPISATSEIEVVTVITATGVPTTLIETTDYSVTATNQVFDEGGTVTTVATYASTITITIRRITPQTQITDFSTDRLARSTIEDTVDKLTKLIQDMQEELDRALKFPVPESNISTLPNSILRANEYVAIDDSGGVTTTPGTSSDVVLPTATKGYHFVGDGSGWTALNLQIFYVSQATTANDLDILVNTDMSGVTEAIIWRDTDNTASANITTGAGILWMASPGAVTTINDGAVIEIATPAHVRTSYTQQIWIDNNTEEDGVRFTEGGIVSPYWWGATDGGEIGPSMQSCYVAVNSAKQGTIYIPPGDYTYTSFANRVSSPVANYFIDQCDGVRIEATGAKITYSAVSAISFEPFLRLINTDNTAIEGIFVDGNVDNIGFATGSGYCLWIQSARGVDIANCTLINSQLDNILVDADATNKESKNGTIRNCILNGGSRDCIGFVSAIGWTVDSCDMKNAAQGAHPRANKVGIVFEAEVAGEVVDNITINNCFITNSEGNCVQQTNSNGTTKNVTFNNCFIEVDEDGTAGPASGINIGSEGQNYRFNNCHIRGNITISGQVILDGCTLVTDATIATGAGSAHRMINYLAAASEGCAVRDCTFDIASGTYAPQFFVLANRNGNSVGWTLPVTGCTFTTNGSTITTSNFTDMGTLHTDDFISWEANRFVHVSTSPATPYVANLLPHTSQVYIAPDNIFDADLRLGSSTGLSGRFLSAAVDTFANLDATPSVFGNDVFRTFTNSLTITDLDDGYDKQIVNIISKAAITYDTTGTDLTGSSVDIVTAAGDVTTWINDGGTTWIMVDFRDASIDNSGGD